MSVKTAIKKKEFSFEDLKQKFSNKISYKTDRFFDLGDAFYEVTGFPGPAMGHVNLLLGHSDTAKTMSLILTAADAQKKGILPVLIITEQKWSFEHAKMLGMDINKKGDDWEGFFLYKTGFNYIEQVFDYIREIIDAQEKGEIPYDIVFLWDSVGSIPCQMSYMGKGGTQHTARVISEQFGMGLAQRITSSRNAQAKYTNTIVIVNQPWVEIDMQNPMNQPKIRSKGGNAIYLSSTLVFLFGLQKNSGISRIMATRNGRKINFATLTKVGILKNHVNGLGFADGRILATPHGFIKNDKESIQEYKENYSDYWNTIFNQSGTEESVGSIDIGTETIVDIEDV